MSASATRESGGHAGARRLAKGVASGGGKTEHAAVRGGDAFGEHHFGHRAVTIGEVCRGGGRAYHAALGPKPCSQNGQLQRGPC